MWSTMVYRAAGISRAWVGSLKGKRRRGTRDSLQWNRLHHALFADVSPDSESVCVWAELGIHGSRHQAPSPPAPVAAVYEARLRRVALPQRLEQVALANLGEEGTGERERGAVSASRACCVAPVAEANVCKTQGNTLGRRLMIIQHIPLQNATTLPWLRPRLDDASTAR